MHHIERLHAAVAPGDPKKLRHLPAVLSHETLDDLVHQLGLKLQAAGGVDSRELDRALQATSLSTSDKIRLKTVFTGGHPITRRRIG